MLKRFSAVLLLVGLLSGLNPIGPADAASGEKCKPRPDHCEAG